MAFTPGEIISYPEMCLAEGTSLQRGMNFRLSSGHSVLLMSRRPGAPYNDRIEDEGRVLVYEGHDATRVRDGPDPKTIDQPEYTHAEAPTQNRSFREAAARYQSGPLLPRSSGCTRNCGRASGFSTGRFGSSIRGSNCRAADRCSNSAWSSQRTDSAEQSARIEIAHTRLIPTGVKLDVFKRDRGMCQKCGSTDNLHFDHILPFSKGGTSLTAENVQLLCARHNLEKHDRIE